VPRFGKRSRGRLETCHQDLQVVMNKVVKKFDCTILEGHRGKEKQNKAFEDGKSKKKWPTGKHNQDPSVAVDVIPYPVNWENTDRMTYFAGYVMGIAWNMLLNGEIKHIVRWGRDWKTDWPDQDKNSSTFLDYPHFELMDAK